MGKARGAVILFGALVTCGCGGDDDRDAGSLSGSCALGVELSGAISRSQRPSEQLACATQHSFESGVDNLFLSTNAELRFELGIADIEEGATGQYPAHVEILVEARRFRTATNGCSVNVTEHALVARENTEIGEVRRYRVVGSGSCSAPAEPVNEQGEPVTVGSFQFRQPAVWRG
ncbi:MAG TPA: hypothetical protein VI072_23285 [Polyangiaceae bacterium]